MATQEIEKFISDAVESAKNLIEQRLEQETEYQETLQAGVTKVRQALFAIRSIDDPDNASEIENYDDEVFFENIKDLELSTPEIQALVERFNACIGNITRLKEESVKLDGDEQEETKPKKDRESRETKDQLSTKEVKKRITKEIKKFCEFRCSKNFLEEVGWSKYEIKKLIQSLISQEYIKAEGSGRGAHYIAGANFETKGKTDDDGSSPDDVGAPEKEKKEKPLDETDKTILEKTQTAEGGLASNKNLALELGFSQISSLRGRLINLVNKGYLEKRGSEKSIKYFRTSKEIKTGTGIEPATETE